MIPFIDLAAEPARAAAAVDAALAEAGFFGVQGHGVPPAVVDAAFDAARRFFALPEADKRRWHIDHWPLQRGFDPIGWQALDPARPPDLKESFYLGAQAHGPNQWPDEALVPGFRAACDAYAQAMHALALRLMRVFEVALRLPPGHFDRFMREPQRTTRLLHYPARAEATAVQPGQLGCGAHTDWGALTLLTQQGGGGLQVQRIDSTWIDVVPPPGTYVVNIGDLMARWTNDRWRSTPHRVTGTGGERWSIAFFFDLDADALIEPLPGCVSAERPARHAPITAGEHLAEMYRRTTVAG